MTTFSRWLAPALLATGLGVAGLVPKTAHAQGDELVRVLVDVADVMLRGGQPYYRHGDYGYNDRIVVVRDRYGRPTYYRHVPRGLAYGYDHRRPDVRRTRCNSNGKCKVEYYDPRYDRRYNDRYYGHDGRYDRYYRYGDRRWRDRYDD